jgi:hypothetical protein
MTLAQKIKLTTLFLCMNITPCIGYTSGGGTIIPIKTDSTKTFNDPNKTISIYLDKSVWNKDSDLFTRDKEIAITAKLEINSIKDNGEKATVLSTRAYTFDIAKTSKGQMEIPLRKLPILEQCNICGEDYQITSIVVHLFITKKKEGSSFSKALQAIIAVSRKMPVQSNPYTESLSKFGDIFNQIADAALQEADTAPLASFGLVLDGYHANGNPDHAGTYAVIFDGRKEHFVSCFDADTSPAIKSAPINLSQFNNDPLLKMEFDFDKIRGLTIKKTKIAKPVEPDKIKIPDKISIIPGTTDKNSELTQFHEVENNYLIFSVTQGTRRLITNSDGKAHLLSTRQQ